MKLRNLFITLIALCSIVPICFGACETKESEKFLEHKRYLNSAFFSQDGTKAITTSADGTAKVWDLETREEIVLDLPKGITLPSDPASLFRSASFSSNGKLVAALYDSFEVGIWDSQDGTLIHLLHGHTGTTRSAEFSEDNKFIITSSNDETAKIWSVENGKCLKTLKGHTSFVTSASFSPLEENIAVSSSFDKSVNLWNTDTGESVKSFCDEYSMCHSSGFSPCGRFVIVSFGTTAKIWDIKEDLIVKCFKHSGMVRSAAFSPSGELVITVTSEGPVNIWDVDSGKIIKTFSENCFLGKVSMASFSPDCKFVIIACGKIARIFPIAQGETKMIDLGDMPAERTEALSKATTEKTITIKPFLKSKKFWAGCATVAVGTIAFLLRKKS